MTVEIGVIFGLVGCIVGLLTFVISRQSSAKTEGSRWGRIEEKVEHIGHDIAWIKSQIEKIAGENKESIQKIYQRMDSKFDDHIRQFHGGGNKSE